MAKYRVSYEARFTGSIEVDASSEDMAIQIVETIPYDMYIENASNEDIQVEWADEVSE